MRIAVFDRFGKVIVTMTGDDPQPYHAIATKHFGDPYENIRCVRYSGPKAQVDGFLADLRSVHARIEEVTA